ncbi:MAG: MBL fold metallo-hydrolase [Deltaproteobacteria bacterium]|nr:MAG: MBL fold metallo-hydrolase [Deltaproteobacteria bacterium]
MQIKPFFDEATWTMTYVVYDAATKDAVVIDPVLDFDPIAVSTSTGSVDEVSAFLKENDLNLHYILETHAHADHLSGSQVLKERFGAKVGIGEHITTVQETFKGIFNLEPEFATDGSQFDKLFSHGETFTAGSLSFEVIHNPGHTPACISYHIEDALFTGDALFMPDFGTGRCDFPAGSATDLYESVTERLYALPDETRVFVGHDYGPGGRAIAWETTIGESKAKNKQLTVDTDREQFIQWRMERDATLSPPRLLFQSVQVNVRAGQMPPAEDNERSYIKLPIGLFD